MIVVQVGAALCWWCEPTSLSTASTRPKSNWIFKNIFITIYHLRLVIFYSNDFAFWNHVARHCDWIYIGPPSDLPRWRACRIHEPKCLWYESQYPLGFNSTCLSNMADKAIISSIECLSVDAFSRSAVVDAYIRPRLADIFTSGLFKCLALRTDETVCLV